MSQDFDEICWILPIADASQPICDLGISISKCCCLNVLYFPISSPPVTAGVCEAAVSRSSPPTSPRVCAWCRDIMPYSHTTTLTYGSLQIPTGHISLQHLLFNTTVCLDCPITSLFALLVESQASFFIGEAHGTLWALWIRPFYQDPVNVVAFKASALL